MGAWRTDFLVLLVLLNQRHLSRLERWDASRLKLSLLRLSAAVVRRHRLRALKNQLVAFVFLHWQPMMLIQALQLIIRRGYHFCTFHQFLFCHHTQVLEPRGYFWWRHFTASRFFLWDQSTARELLLNQWALGQILINLFDFTDLQFLKHNWRFISLWLVYDLTLHLTHNRETRTRGMLETTLNVATLVRLIMINGWLHRAITIEFLLSFLLHFAEIRAKVGHLHWNLMRTFLLWHYYIVLVKRVQWFML